MSSSVEENINILQLQKLRESESTEIIINDALSSNIISDKDRYYSTYNNIVRYMTDLERISCIIQLLLSFKNFFIKDIYNACIFEDNDSSKLFEFLKVEVFDSYRYLEYFYNDDDDIPKYAYIKTKYKLILNKTCAYRFIYTPAELDADKYIEQIGLPDFYVEQIQYYTTMIYSMLSTTFNEITNDDYYEDFRYNLDIYDEDLDTLLNLKNESDGYYKDIQDIRIIDADGNVIENSILSSPSHFINMISVMIENSVEILSSDGSSFNIKNLKIV